MQETCRICGDSEFFLQYKGSQVGVYCANCGKWIKWLSKKDQAIYKNRGFKIYPPNVEVKLKGNFARGVSVTPITNNLGFEDVGDSSFGGQVIPTKEEPTVNKVVEPIKPTPSNEDIERYIQNEVTKRLKIYVDKFNAEHSVAQEPEEGYCSVCDGTPLESDNANSVDVCIFSGTLSVTNKEGTQIMGLYKLKRCTNCGRIF